MSVEKFWTLVNKRGPTPRHCQEIGECWLWTGAVYLDGYGCVPSTLFGTRKAHKVAAIVSNIVENASDYMVLHRCDNPPCCNPKHLYRGDFIDNLRDRCSRGRSPLRPGNEGKIQLLPKDVAVIRSIENRTNSSVAKEFGVDPETIRRIRKLISWRGIA
jgi:hypothetical protein